MSNVYIHRDFFLNCVGEALKEKKIDSKYRLIFSQNGSLKSGLVNILTENVNLTTKMSGQNMSSLLENNTINNQSLGAATRLSLVSENTTKIQLKRFNSLSEQKSFFVV